MQTGMLEGSLEFGISRPKVSQLRFGLKVEICVQKKIIYLSERFRGKFFDIPSPVIAVQLNNQRFYI